MTDSAFAAPTAERDRLSVMDTLRGVALLGIFLMNIEYFSRPLATYLAGAAPASGLDAAAGIAIYLGVQGKFWVLFALLFGMGFALMRDRAEREGRPFIATYLRRLVLLAAFGLAHATLLWVGDILLAYALAALGLLVLGRVHGGARVLLGVGLYLLATGFWVVSGVGLMHLPEAEQAGVRAEMARYVAEATQAEAVYRHGDFLAITQQRVADLRAMLGDALIFQLPSMLGVFLIGSWLVQGGRLADPQRHRRFFVLLAAFGGLLGVAGVAASASVGLHFDPATEVAEGMLAMGLMGWGSLPLALAYLAVFALLASGSHRRALSWLAPAGRMALTNYLLQSVVGSFIFYGYGLGLWGEVGRSGQVGIVLVVFAAQVAFSHWWLARYRFGPMEWLWRAGTYLQWPPMRRVADA